MPPGPNPYSRPTGSTNSGGNNQTVSWPSLAHKARLLFASWSAAAADARAALALADHVRRRLPLLIVVPPPSSSSSSWSACGRALQLERPDARARVLDAHLRDVEEELRRAAAARDAMAEAARGLGRLAAAAAAGAGAVVLSSSSSSQQQHHPLSPGPAPLEVAETLQDLWRACAAENQLHEAAAARCAVPAVEGGGGGGGAAATAQTAPSAASAGWDAALTLLDAEVNVDRARFEAFFDVVQQAW
jgi:hypothetical protein